jgi:hypothetical protein
VLKARLAALAFVLVVHAAVAQATPSSTILVLSGGSGSDDARLVEALRIYTSDVEGRLVLSGKAPEAPAPRVLEQLASTAAREGADLVVWAARRADGSSVYYVFDVASRDLRETEIEPLGAERAAVAVALKVRAALFRRRGQAEVPRAEAPPRPAPVVVSSPLAKPPVEAEPPNPVVAVKASPAPAPAFHRWSLSTGYALVVPQDPTWLRHGLSVAIEARVWRHGTGGLSVFADAALETHASDNVGGVDLTLTDWPFGAGALWEWQGTVAGFAFGPRAALHAFELSGQDGASRSGAVWRPAVGLGALARVDFDVTSYMKVYLGASLEAFVLKQKFTFLQQPMTDTGNFGVAISAGLRWLLL